MTKCVHCGKAINGDGNITSIGTLCDTCETYAVPHYCSVCEKELKFGLCYCVVTGHTRTGKPIEAMLCPDCCKRLL